MCSMTTLITSKFIFLDAFLQMVGGSCQDTGETHHLGTLGQAKGEELILAGQHEAGVAFLTKCLNCWIDLGS